MFGKVKRIETRSESFLGATRDIVESAGGSRANVIQTPYPYGTLFDVAFSIFGLSDGAAYTAAQDILNNGVCAGDTVNFVGHSGGGQRLAMAARILRDYDIYSNTLASIPGPVAGGLTTW